MPLTDENRKLIFNTLENHLKKCCPPMIFKKSKPDSCEIIGNKPVPYGYKKKIVPGMYFASAVARKDMVSFYFFPIYINNEKFRKTAPTLMKCLKGKSCFNIKKPEQIVEKELEKLLKIGIEVWKKLGYLVES